MLMGRQMIDEARLQYSNARSIKRIIESEECELALEKCSQLERDKLLAHISKVDKVAVRKWLSENTLTPLGAKNIRELIEMARKRGIQGYSRKSKSQLLSDLSQEEHDEES